jgi:hypothetical protein
VQVLPGRPCSDHLQLKTWPLRSPCRMRPYWCGLLARKPHCGWARKPHLRWLGSRTCVGSEAALLLGSEAAPAAPALARKLHCCLLGSEAAPAVGHGSRTCVGLGSRTCVGSEAAPVLARAGSRTCVGSEAAPALARKPHLSRRLDLHIDISTCSGPSPPKPLSSFNLVPRAHKYALNPSYCSKGICIVS